MTQNGILNVGIIGCGDVTQVIHLPTLRELSGHFKIVALCDVSQKVLNEVGAQLPDASRHVDAAELIKLSKVDVVLIANPNAYHAVMAITALQAGKHVMIEKPMCMTLAEADALTAAEKACGKVVQIGYMRRYAPAFEEAVGLVADMKGKINYARVRDIIGPNSSFVEPTINVVRGDDIPNAVLDMTSSASSQRLIEAIGTDQNPKAMAYNILLGLSSHDTSAMRELIGMPKRVLHATMRKHGMFMTVVFDYGDFVCHYETGIDSIARFDAHLEVYGEDRIVRVDYETPYIRNLPARLSVTECKTKYGVSVTQSHATRGDAFIVEWKRLHGSIVNGAPNKTSIADARLDLELFAQIMAHF